jgi:hypothetical protein
MANSTTYSDDSYAEIQSKPNQPLLPEGLHDARCDDASLQDSKFKDAPLGSKVLKLRWELDKQYEDEQSRERHYVLYSKPFNLSVGEKSSLYQLCKSLTGQPPRQEDREVEINGQKTTKRVFNFRKFVGMRAKLVIKNNEHNGQTYSNITDYMTDEPQRLENLKDHELPDL